MNASQFFGAMFGPLRQLADFSGRSTRAQFWPFVFLIYALGQIISFAAVYPLFNAMGVVAEQQAAGTMSQQAADAALGEAMLALIPQFFWLIVISGTANVVLLAAAATRRLHDTDRSGWWGFPCAILMLTGTFLMYQAFLIFTGWGNDPGAASFEAAMAIVVPLLLNNLVYLGFFVALIIFCATDGTPGPNRYGEDPKGRDPAEEAERVARLAALRQASEAARKNPAVRPAAARITPNPIDERLS